MTVPGRDLTRADARQAIKDAKRALGGLNHLAIAGLLQADGDLSTMAKLVATYDLTVTLVDDILGLFALQLPEEEATDG
jgi:hypothetical protein